MEIKQGLETRFKEFKYNNSKDAYSKAVVDYMIRWAELMEKEPNLTKEKAEKLSDVANTQGITGFMYDMARKYLYKFWKHGDKLKELLGTEMVSMFTIGG